MFDSILPFFQHEAFVPAAGAIIGLLVPAVFTAVSRRLGQEIRSDWKAVVSFAISFVIASVPMVIAWIAKGQVSADEFWQSVPVAYTSAVLFYEKYLKPRILKAELEAEAA